MSYFRSEEVRKGDVRGGTSFTSFYHENLKGREGGRRLETWTQVRHTIRILREEPEYEGNEPIEDE